MPGKTSVDIICLAVDLKLQWGPGRMPGKTAQRVGDSLDRVRASMGPRQDAGEDRASRITVLSGSWRFNGAPAGCRGRLVLVVEPKRIDIEASMGPRQDAGEDVGHFVVNVSDELCFNGAPAGCRGRLDSPVTITVAMYKLQWGPGRMPGKTHPGIN